MQINAFCKSPPGLTEIIAWNRGNRGLCSNGTETAIGEKKIF
ncbi:hypothetical protein Q0N71_23160 [Bacillus thuringiensis]